MHASALAGAVTLATAALGLTPISASATGAEGPVVAIVRIAKPALAPRALVAAKMRETRPEYLRAEGLAFKAYSIERESGDYGGLYLWRDAAAARAWFGPAWFERVKRERGVEGHVRFFAAPLSVDNVPGGTPPEERSGSVATLVEIAVPAGVTAERLLAGFRAAVPQYQRIPGLLRKSFTWSSGPDGSPATFGGVYLWRDEASARAWFNEAWHARVRQTYAAPARIEWFDTPVLLPVPGTTLAAGAMIGTPSP